MLKINLDQKYRVRIPKRFYRDCVECECDVPIEVEGNKRFCTIEGSTEQYDELISRAKHYSDPEAFDRENCPEIVQLSPAAERLLSRLKLLGFDI